MKEDKNIFQGSDGRYYCMECGEPVEEFYPAGSLKENKKQSIGDVLKQVMPQDFIKFGLIPEFIGRVPVVVTLNALDEEALIRILKEPKNSLLRQYRKLFEMDGVELEFDEPALKSIAEKAMERKTGARGLRSIVEDTVMDLMFEIPSDDTIRKCIITKDAVEKKGEPVITRGEAGPVMPKKTAKKRRGSVTA